MKTLKDLVIGDSVVRDMCGMKMNLEVTCVHDMCIECGPWVFSRKNGAEIDPELGWNEEETGSYIMVAQ